MEDQVVYDDIFSIDEMNGIEYEIVEREEEIRSEKYYEEMSKNTFHPAVDNMRRKVTVSNGEFNTIASFISAKNQCTKCDMRLILISELTDLKRQMNRDTEWKSQKSSLELFIKMTV